MHTTNFSKKSLQKKKIITELELIDQIFIFILETLPNLGIKIEKSILKCEDYIIKCNIIQPEPPISNTEQKGVLTYARYKYSFQF